MKDRDEFPMLIVANKADLEKNRQVTTIYLQQATGLGSILSFQVHIFCKIGKLPFTAVLG